MRHKIVSGIHARGKIVEWTTLRAAKDGVTTVESRSVALNVGDDAPADALSLIKGHEGGYSSELAAQCPRFKGLVSLGLPSDRVMLRVLNLPAVSPSEMASMVRLQADKLSPFPAAGTEVAHEVLDENQGSCRVLVAATQRETVDVLHNAFRKAGIALGRLDVDLLGWWCLLAGHGGVKKKGREIFLILDGGACDLIVTDDGLPLVFRFVGRQESAVEDDFFAEVAREIGCTITSLELEHGAGSEISIAVWHRDKPPESLAERLKTECGCDVSCAALASLPPLSEGIARRVLLKDTAVLDLRPAEWKQEQLAGITKKKMALAAVGVVLAWALGLAVLFGGLKIEKAKLASLEAKLAELSGPAKQVQESQKRVAALRQYGDKTRSALECLRELCEVLPRGVDLTVFSYKKGKNVIINGQASSAELVYEFKKAVDASKLYTRVDLEGPARQTSGKETFKITMDIPGGGE